MAENNAPEGYIDVWLKFDTNPGDPDWDEDDDLATHEANTRMTDTGYAIDWYLNSVGLVTTVEFDTLTDAYDWYEANGYQDFTA